MREGGYGKMGKKASNDARAGACAEKPAVERRKKPDRTPYAKKRRLIVERMKALGVYKPQYDALIGRTARLYVKLDELEKEYEKSGCSRFVEYTNKAGATNLVPNPHIRAIEDAYAELLVHERELGLTPAAMKKLGDVGSPTPKKSPLEMALEKLSSG